MTGPVATGGFVVAWSPRVRKYTVAPDAAAATTTRSNVSNSCFAGVSHVVCAGAAPTGRSCPVAAGSGIAAAASEAPSGPDGGGGGGAAAGAGAGVEATVSARPEGRPSTRRTVPLAAFRAACASSPHEPNRSSGVLAMAVAITPSNAWGSSGRTRVTDGGGSTRCACSTACSVPCENGGELVRDSYSTQPNAYTSVRASTGPPSICSGAAYSTVPRKCPVDVRPRAVVCLATPKSVRYA